ncbi:uncharacterized protein LOC133204659 [Saccostrea echinata]|uniref:uncharacterized protein LOC133204659 n=1 Tax=Saccostrea echinata TaxID=191078 RepID=UPI002A81F40D|nr:uncharacterized protein LOC133204659 [Saccostrea echinata]
MESKRKTTGAIEKWDEKEILRKTYYNQRDVNALPSSQYRSEPSERHGRNTEIVNNLHENCSKKYGIQSPEHSSIKIQSLEDKHNKSISLGDVSTFQSTKGMVKTSKREGTDVKLSATVEEGIDSYKSSNVHVYKSSSQPSPNLKYSLGYPGYSLTERRRLSDKHFIKSNEQTTAAIEILDEKKILRKSYCNQKDADVLLSSQYGSEVSEIHGRNTEKVNNLHQNCSKKHEKQLPEHSSIKTESFEDKCNKFSDDHIGFHKMEPLSNVVQGNEASESVLQIHVRGFHSEDNGIYESSERKERSQNITINTSQDDLGSYSKVKSKEEKERKINCSNEGNKKYVPSKENVICSNIMKDSPTNIDFQGRQSETKYWTEDGQRNCDGWKDCSMASIRLEDVKETTESKFLKKERKGTENGGACIEMIRSNNTKKGSQCLPQSDIREETMANKKENHQDFLFKEVKDLKESLRPQSKDEKGFTSLDEVPSFEKIDEKKTLLEIKETMRISDKKSLSLRNPSDEKNSDSGNRGEFVENQFISQPREMKENNSSQRDTIITMVNKVSREKSLEGKEDMGICEQRHQSFTTNEASSGKVQEGSEYQDMKKAIGIAKNTYGKKHDEVTLKDGYANKTVADEHEIMENKVEQQEENNSFKHINLLEKNSKVRGIENRISDFETNMSPIEVEETKLKFRLAVQETRNAKGKESCKESKTKNVSAHQPRWTFQHNMETDLHNISMSDKHAVAMDQNYVAIKDGALPARAATKNEDSFERSDDVDEVMDNIVKPADKVDTPVSDASRGGLGISIYNSEESKAKLHTKDLVVVRCNSKQKEAMGDEEMISPSPETKLEKTKQNHLFERKVIKDTDFSKESNQKKKSKCDKISKVKTQKSLNKELKERETEMGELMAEEGYKEEKRESGNQTDCKSMETIACKQNSDKETVKYIFTVLKQLEDENDLLSHLIGIVSNVQFRIHLFENNSKTKTTTVALVFKSDVNAKSFESCLRRNSMKLNFRYHFKKETVSKTKLVNINKKLQYIKEKTVEVLGKHQDKERKTQSQISNLSTAPLSSKKKIKYTKLFVHEQREAQKKALSDKFTELEQQQNEFKSFLSETIQKIECFKAGNMQQKELDSLLKQFEVECTRLEQALPIYAKRTEIIDTILSHQVSVILGETGSGKSTQITQYILESELSSFGKIICTQPRKVAAMSLAQRVASELKAKVGDLVGYQTGMKAKLNNQTKVLYMTDHMLLNECLKDPLLMNFSCIVIDEAHERSVYTDLLLGMIKKCLPQRPELRVVITSATIVPDVFVQYFGGPQFCPVLKVSGRMFPVEIEWLVPSSGADVVDDYEIKAIEKAAEIHRNEPPGDILVFLTSQAEIEQCAEKLDVLLKGRKDHWILPLHGKLQTEEQNLVFKDPPRGRRKIVLATNVAETSVTIPGVKYVVDTGAVKELLYDPKKKVSSLRVVKVTKSSADQRKGRAGRTGPGKCYRLYSKEDYDIMCPTSVPEILKIHLGHAILKLLQLNVDPLEFDFVQAPEKVSMTNAFQHLNKLGAIEDGKISPLGKWIAKLPFEPSLGVLTHDAIDSNVGLEGIIIAASCTVSGSLFYRGGTKEEKEKSDKLKVPFCHKYGDHFTNLEVYKEWHKVTEKQKGRWCKDNSINGKAMRSIRDAANEILFILKRDLSITMKFEFTGAEDVERKLQKLLFRSFQSNLCHFLGHEKAGYYFIDKNQQVIMHPSSAFQSLASCPNWVIVEKVMQTSRDFALNITAVADEDVEEALNEGSLDFDIDDVERRKVAPVLTEYVGVQVHREFVGPRYSNVRAMQDNLKLECEDSIFVIDADRERGEISIYAPISDSDISSRTLKTAIDPIREKIRNETVEHPLLPEFSNVRISIGAGGQVQDLLYQDEYKNVFIFGEAHAFSSEEDMVQWFRRFGPIQSFIPKSSKNINPKYLGQIVFEKPEFAKTAVIATRKGKCDFEISAKPPKGFGKSEEDDLLRARLVWCRRKSRGFGFVEIHDQDKIDHIIVYSALNHFVVGGKRVRVKRGNNGRDEDEETHELFVSGLGDLVNEDVLRESFLNTFDISENDIGKVVVIREKVNTTPQMLHSLRTRIESQFKEYTGIRQNKFNVTLLEPKPASFTYQAFVTFKDPEEGFEACTKIRNKMFIGEHAVSVTPEIHTRIFVLAQVYKRVKSDIEKYHEKIKNENTERRLTITVQKNENYVIDIDADSIESMVRTRNKVQELLEGETVDLEKIPALRYLFTRDGQEKVEKIMKKTETLILLDHRNSSLSVHGRIGDRRIAVGKVRKYVEKLSSSRLRVIDLKGETKPPGLMKAVILMHGVDLNGLKVSSNLSTVDLDHRNHRIKMLGSDDAVEKAVQNINEIIDCLRKNSQTATSDQPECGICFCEIAESEIYRLESCGHPYCRDCMKMNIESAIRSKDFPIKCCHDQCDMLWAWKDFLNMTRSGFCSLQNILNSTVSSFAMGNKDKIRYCITPDCPMVYKVSKDGGRIVCSACRTSMCSKCHVEYHSGISCAMYQMENGNDETGLREWMRRDPHNRKLCPNCFAGIEKNGGCQHMECRDCKSHICWICMEFFKTSRECYGHMNKEHNTFV